MSARILVVDDDIAYDSGMALTAALRRAGWSATLVATGSPKKRFDKALKLGATEIVLLTDDGGATEIHVRVNGGGASRLEGVLFADDWASVGR